MTYVEQFAAMQAREAARPKTVYITNEEFRRQKTALTRAINSGVPQQVLTTVAKTVKEWEGKCWPDDWARWRRALEDAASSARKIARETRDWDQQERMEAVAEEIQAASYVLFP